MLMCLMNLVMKYISLYSCNKEDMKQSFWYADTTNAWFVNLFGRSILSVAAIFCRFHINFKHLYHECDIKIAMNNS